jgi:hypothetical protein
MFRSLALIAIVFLRHLPFESRRPDTSPTVHNKGKVINYRVIPSGNYTLLSTLTTNDKHLLYDDFIHYNSFCHDANNFLNVIILINIS